MIEPDVDESTALPPEPSLATLVRALIEDIRTLVEAESGYVRAAVAFALGRVKSIAILIVLALFLLWFTLLAAVVGVLIALVPLIGAWAAAGAVTGVLAVSCAICAALAVSRGRRMVRLLTGAEGAR